MQIPGFLWTAILALIPLLVGWLGGDYFAGQGWVAWVVIVLGGVLKALELYREQHGSQARMTSSKRAAPPATEHPLRKFWLG